MKILSNKKYGGLVNEIKNLNEEITKLDNVIKTKNNFIKDLLFKEAKSDRLIEKLDNASGSLQEKNEILSNELEAIKEKYRKLSNAKGGLVKQINKLTKELEESNLKIADLKSDRYLIKKLPADKPKNTQEMVCRGVASNKKSEIIRKVTK
jgi:chromosome segregation ATPase